MQKIGLVQGNAIFHLGHIVGRQRAFWPQRRGQLLAQSDHICLPYGLGIHANLPPVNEQVIITQLFFEDGEGVAQRSPRPFTIRFWPEQHGQFAAIVQHARGGQVSQQGNRLDGAKLKGTAVQSHRRRSQQGNGQHFRHGLLLCEAVNRVKHCNKRGKISLKTAANDLITVDFVGYLQRFVQVPGTGRNI